MAGTTIWKGYIHFGDTDVPVKLHTAVKEERIQFHLLHSRDQVRLRQQMICAYEKIPVAAEEQSKGFEVDHGKYIIVDPDELEQTTPEGNRMIEVHEFVKTSQIDPIFLDRAYYLEPDMQGQGYNALARGFGGDGCGRHMHLDHEKAVLSRGRSGDREDPSPEYAEACRRSDLGGIPWASKRFPVGKRAEDRGRLDQPVDRSFRAAEISRTNIEKKLLEMIEKKARGEKIAVLAPRRLKPTESDELLQVLEASLKKAA